MAGNRAEVSKMPKVLWMDGDVVAQEAYDAVMAGKAVIINGRLNNFLAYLARILPQVPVRQLMARNQRNAKAKV